MLSGITDCELSTTTSARWTCTSTLITLAAQPLKTTGKTAHLMPPVMADCALAPVILNVWIICVPVTITTVCTHSFVFSTFLSFSSLAVRHLLHWHGLRSLSCLWLFLCSLSLTRPMLNVFVFCWTQCLGSFLALTILPFQVSFSGFTHKRQCFTAGQLIAWWLLSFLTVVGRTLFR